MIPRYRCWRGEKEWEGWKYDQRGQRTHLPCPFCGNLYLTWLNYEEMREDNFR